MGLFGSLTGLDQQKYAHNAILANLLVETAPAALKAEIARSILKVCQKFGAPTKFSDIQILAGISGLSRIKQMNFIAIACLESGIPSPIPNVIFMFIQNPSQSESQSSLDRLGVATQDLSRRAGRNLTWPGNGVREDLMSWLGTQSQNPSGSPSSATCAAMAVNCVLASYVIQTADERGARLIAEKAAAMLSEASPSDSIAMQNATADLTYLPRSQQMYIVAGVCLLNGIPSGISSITWSDVAFVEDLSENYIATVLGAIYRNNNILIHWPRARLDFQSLYYTGIPRSYDFCVDYIQPV